MNYIDKVVLLASKHSKEQAIEPVLRQKLGCQLHVDDIDTDLFGTFTGEIPRTACFPSHALTLQSADRQHVIAKGIRDHHQLQALLSEGFNQYSELFIATDMRAMMNPTRMQTIGELAKKLATRINTPCSSCGVLGFGFKSVSGHLPCSLCGHESAMYQHEEWGCIQCDYQEQHPRKDRLIVADPSHCDYCNP